MDRAVGLAAELLHKCEEKIESITLIPMDDGRFEVTVNGILLFSKLKEERHAEPGEICKLIKQLLQEGK